MAKRVRHFAIASALCALGASTAGAQTATVRLCFETPTVSDREEGNFAFTARILGPASGASVWIVATDATGANWVQVGTESPVNGGRVDDELNFGVLNRSAYPLEFRVRTFSAAEAIQAEDNAIDGQPVSDGFGSIVSNACVFELQGEGRRNTRTPALRDGGGCGPC